MIDRRKRNAMIKELLTASAPKVSIYLPTHHAYPDNKQDLIQYKRQLQLLQAALEESRPRREWANTMEKLHQLDDDELWFHTTEGLAVLAAEGRAEAFHLEAPAGPRFYLGENFHLLPLFPLLDKIGQAFLTDISLDRFALYRVSGEGITPEKLPGVKTSFSELFSDIQADTNLRTGSYSGLSGAFHGHGGRAEEAEIGRTKYFHYLDDAFTALHKESGLKMILAGTESTVAEYRQVAKGSFYLEGEIGKPLDSMEPGAIMQQVQKILKPYLEKSLEALQTEISNKCNQGKALTDLGEIRTAAHEGRVASLFLPGSLKDQEQALIDKAVEQVLIQGGKVYTDMEGTLNLPVGHVALLRY
jgi:hypothetical protein